MERPSAVARLRAALQRPDDSFDPSGWPDRLNLGCGFDHRDGYLNVDFQAFHEPDLVADVGDLAMLPDDHYEEVIAQDILEHLPRTATDAVLAEWNRVLAPGGTLTVRVPDLLGLVTLFSRPENQLPTKQELMVQCLFGTQAYTGDTHLTTFTRPLLDAQLRRAGFEPETWSQQDEWLINATARKTSPADWRERWAQHADLLGMKDPAEFLRLAHEKLLGRGPTPEEAQAYGARLDDGSADFRSLLDEIAAQRST